jgi:hypothetical protein
MLRTRSFFSLISIFYKNSGAGEESAGAFDGEWGPQRAVA